MKAADSSFAHFSSVKAQLLHTIGKIFNCNLQHKKTHPTHNTLHQSASIVKTVRRSVNEPAGDTLRGKASLQQRKLNLGSIYSILQLKVKQNKYCDAMKNVFANLW